MYRKVFTTVNTLSDTQIYFSLTIENGAKEGDQTSLVPITFEENRDQPIISGDVEQYKMAVVRLDAPATNLFFFDHKDNFYYVELVDQTSSIASGAIELLYVPTSVIPPEYPSRSVFYYEQFIKSINDAYSLAMTTLIANYEAINGVASWTGDATKPQVAPYVTLDGNLFNWHFDQRGSDSGSNPVQVWMNDHLKRLFSGNIGTFLGYDNSGVRDFRLWFYDRKDNRETVDSVAQYFMLAESSSLSLWHSAYKFVLLSNDLPVRREFISVANKNSSLPNTGAKNVTFPIITDFDLSLGLDSQVSSRIVYNPSIYRYIDMMTSGPLQRLSLECRILTEDGQLLPIYLGPNESFNIKFAFIKQY